MYVYRQVWSTESQLWHVSTLSRAFIAYRHFRVSCPFCTLLAAITHVIIYSSATVEPPVTSSGILMAHETPQLQCYNCAIEWECNVCSVQMEMVTLWTDCIMCSVTFTVVKTILYLCHVHWSVTWNSLWFPLLRLQPICFDLSTAIVIQTLQLPPLVVHSVHCDIELCALHMYSMYIG